MKETALWGYGVSYESELKGSYLVLQPKHGQVPLTHQMAMLMNGDIPGVLPFSHRERDGMDYLYYEITSKQSLEKLKTRRKLKEWEFLKVLTGITETLLSSSSYFLSYSNFILEEQYIYINAATLEVFLLYLPYEETDLDPVKALKELVDRLILMLDPREGVQNHFLHRILVAVRDEAFQIKEFHRLLMDLKLKGEEHSSEQETESFEGMEEVAVAIEAPLPKERGGHQKAVPPLKEVSLSPKDATPGESEKESGQGRRGLLIFALMQVILGAITLLMAMELPLFYTPGGTLDWSVVGGWGLILIALDLYLYKKLSGNSQGSQEPGVAAVQKPQDKKKLKGEGERPGKPGDILKEKGKGLWPWKDKKAMGQVNLTKLASTASGGQPSSTEADPQDFPTVLGMETELIPMAEGAIPQLVEMREGNLVYINIDKAVFVVGKLKEQVDLVIMDKSVSRIHAEILTSNGEYFLRDLNAKNGTYLNGERIGSNQCIPIKNGDVIRFANREYCFVIKE